MLRFTIRDLLWLMVVVGMGVSWSLDRRQLQNERGELREKLVRSRGNVDYWKIQFRIIHDFYRQVYPQESESLDELRRQAVQLDQNEGNPY